MPLRHTNIHDFVQRICFAGSLDGFNSFGWNAELDKLILGLFPMLSSSGRTRFSQLLESVEGINSKTLSLRLRELERDELVTRHAYAEVPVRVEYSLTEKAGHLRPILEQMGEFSTRYCASDIFRDRKPRSFKEALKIPLITD